MSAVLRYIRSYFHRETETEQLQDFELIKTNRGGYPSDVVAFAYDFGAVAIGTSSGRLLLYGQDGKSHDIELSENEDTDQKIQILLIVFLEFDKILVVCEGSLIIHVRLHDGKLSKHQFVLPTNNQNYTWNQTHIQKLSNTQNALLFYSHENVYRLTRDSTSASIVIPEASISTWKSTTNTVSCITTLPSNPSIIFILTNDGATGIYKESQILKSMELRNSEGESIQKLVWRPNNTNIAFGISCSNMFTKWHFVLENDCTLTSQELNSDSSFNFGPYPCNRVKHLNVCTGKNANDSDFLIFQGGKSSGKYDERHLVSILNGNRFERFELSSEVIGICCYSDRRERSGIALIFTNCEIIGIDLDTDDFNVLQPKWFISINNSNPTAHSRVTDIDDAVWKQIQMASKKYWSTGGVSTRKWPLYSKQSTPCNLHSKKASKNQIYISGHSNGNICVWSTAELKMELMFIIKTAAEFGSSLHLDNTYTEKAPDNTKHKIKKIGFYDPFDDEIELQIKHIHFDPQSGTLIAANRGGYIFIYDYSESSEKIPIWEPISTNGSHVISNSLQPRASELDCLAGYQLRSKFNSTKPLVFAVNNSDKIYNLTYLHKYRCLVIGGSFGLVFLDAKHGQIRYSNSFRDCELINSKGSDSVHVDAPMQRFKNLKKSLRKTFRRTKKATANRTDTISSDGLKNQQCRSLREIDVIERPIEAKVEGDGNSQEEHVTCLRFMRFSLFNEENVDDILAVGLNTGTVNFYKINSISSNMEKCFDVEYATRIIPTYKSSVFNIDVTNEEDHSSASTKFILITEEELRVYNCLPLKKQASYKITANEGLKIKNGVVVRNKNRQDQNQLQHCILLSTNDGWLRTHSIAKPSLFYKKPFIDVTDVVAMDSILLTRNGEAACLKRLSELEMFSIFGKTGVNNK